MNCEKRKKIIFNVIQIILCFCELSVIVYVSTYGSLIPLLFTIFVCIIVDLIFWMMKK